MCSKERQRPKTQSCSHSQFLSFFSICGDFVCVTKVKQVSTEFHSSGHALVKSRIYGCVHVAISLWITSVHDNKKVHNGLERAFISRHKIGRRKKQQPQCCKSCKTVILKSHPLTPKGDLLPKLCHCGVSSQAEFFWGQRYLLEISKDWTSHQSGTPSSKT